MREGNVMFVPLVQLRIHTIDKLKYHYDSITSPLDALTLTYKIFKDLDREYMVVITMNSNNKPTGIEIIAVGSLDCTVTTPREIFKRAVLCNAASIILLHNHPSGNLNPSEADVNFTNRIKSAGDLLGINLFDHIIVCDANFLSFRESGLI